MRSIRIYAPAMFLYFQLLLISCTKPETNNDAVESNIDTAFAPVINSGNGIFSAALQKDGKILIGGWFDTCNGVFRKHIARLNASGSTDPAFNPGKGASGLVSAIAVQNDGKILIGGSFTHFYGLANEGICRLLPDGKPDLMFNLRSRVDGSVRVVRIQPDGKILIGGRFVTYNGVFTQNIARINPDGTIDDVFIDGFIGSVNDIAVQPDGKIIIVGEMSRYNTTPIPEIVRLNTDGTIDQSFNTGTGISGRRIEAVVIQPDGKIIIGGYFNSFNGISRCGLARLNNDGAVDAGFIPKNDDGESEDIQSVVLLPGNKIMVTGTSIGFTGSKSGKIARINPDGSVDQSFNPGKGPGSGGVIRNVLHQTDGQMIVAGSFKTFDSKTRWHMARLR